jgi:ATP-dependent exoDNAse (exonuclease V) beta subunit
LSFVQYRRRAGQFTFDDLISFSCQLLEDKEACAILRHRDWRVILDEAQDTDPQQFVILTEVTRPVEATGSWLDGAAHGPRPGAFSMVGDPQQSIYSDRADLGRYLAVHQRLIEEGGEGATFSVTMRCPVSVVESLNRVFPSVLKPEGPESRQVNYVRLDNPKGARTGQIVRITAPSPDPDVDAKSGPREAANVQSFARWLKDLSPQDLGTDSWAQVAVLCPRNRWLDALAESLTAAGLPIQQISRSATRAGDPTYAWFAALLSVFAQPRDSFELYGVLRDVFGFSDDHLVQFIERTYTHGEAHPLRIDMLPGDMKGAVADALRELNALYLRVRVLPLYAAVELILKHCQLGERLVQVPGIDQQAVDSTIDTLRQQTAEAESLQKNLIEWAEEQRRALPQPIDEKESSEEAITLVTAHKSKGLGFDVVILPFFFRKFGMPPEAYPCFESGGTAGPKILFGSDDRDETTKDWQETRRRELHERLLYVGLTRVKRSLILFDDRAWWADLRAQKGVSWAQLMKVDDPEEPNAKTWNALPTQLVDLDEDEARAEASPEPPGASIVAQSIEAGSSPTFWRRVTPSSLQLHEEPSERIEPDLSSDERFPEEIRELYLKDPAAYGNWWHDMMEHAPWEMDEALIRIHFENTLKICPDPNRGAKELDTFLSNDLFRQLSQEIWKVYTEVSFLSGDTSSKTGYEGFIDLLAVKVESDDWLIIDWKTDRMGSEDPMGALLHAYGPQLAVYDATMQQSLGEKGQSLLYSTVTGETVFLTADGRGSS